MYLKMFQGHQTMTVWSAARTTSPPPPPPGRREQMSFPRSCLVAAIIFLHAKEAEKCRRCRDIAAVKGCSERLAFPGVAEGISAE